MQLHHNNAPLTEDDYPQLSETYKISLNIVEEVVNALKKGARPPLYEGTVRQRIRELCADIAVVDDSSEDTPQVEQVAIGEEESSTAPQEEAKNDDLAPRPRKERESVAEYASTQLMRAMTSEDQNFLISEEGICTINEQNPPAITESYKVVSNVLDLRELSGKMDEKTSWMLGSIVASLEDFHGEDFSITQVCDDTTKSYNTIATTVGVYKAFKDRPYDLPFTTYKEVHYKKMDKDPKKNKELQKLVLHKTEKYELNSKHARELCSIIKKMDGDDTTVRNIRSQGQAFDLIDAHADLKADYIIYNEGKWGELKGENGVLPDGAVVLDLKNKKSYKDGKFMSPIERLKA